MDRDGEIAIWKSIKILLDKKKIKKKKPLCSDIPISKWYTIWINITQSRDNHAINFRFLCFM